VERDARITPGLQHPGEDVYVSAATAWEIATRIGKLETSKGLVQDFVEAIPSCEEKLSAYEQDGNKLILAALDEFLDRAEAGLLKFL